MGIRLDKELTEYVQERIRSGDYPSATDVVATALRIMREMQETEVAANDDLRKAVAEGLAQLDRGEGEPWDVEKTRAKLLAEWSRQKKAG